jgi:hypothetical protein
VGSNAMHPHLALRGTNQTAATELLGALSGDDARAAQALAALGGPGRLDVIMSLGGLNALTQALASTTHIAQLNDPSTPAPQREAAMQALRDAAAAYSAQAEITALAAPRGEARIGEPAQWPPQTDARGPRANPVDAYTFVREVIYKGVGGQLDRNINRTLDRFVYQPWDRFVAQPTRTAAAELYGRFTETPVGAFLEGQRIQAAGALEAVVGEGTPFANALGAVDRHLVRNDRLWEAVDTAGLYGRRFATGAAGTALALVANAYRTGTLQTGTFNTSAELTPQQAKIVRQVNIPSNMNVRYFTVPMTAPVTVRGQTIDVPAHATIVVGEGSNVLLLPALGPGQPGAQPWFGPVQDGGPSRQERQLVSASSSVAAAHWSIVGFNIGTDNFNVGGRADLQVGRGLLNIFAAQFRRQDPAPGAPRLTLQSILIGDAVSTFHSMTLNVGPGAFVVDRFRNPQNERVTLPNGQNTVTFGRDEHSSAVQPAIPLTGAATWDPNAPDIQAFKALFGLPADLDPR